jgi:hypothetical protein
MSFYEHEDCFVWQCDHCQRQAEFPPRNFYACVDELKARGWSFSRGSEGEWSHRCKSCQRSAKEILNEPFLKKRA